jgi:hypothetical protein
MNKTSPTRPTRKAAKAAKPVTKSVKATASAQPLMPLPLDASTRKRSYDGGHSQITSFKTDGSALAIIMASGRFHTMGEAINFCLRSVVVNYSL